MALVLNGDGNVTGLTPGGLPDASITQADLAAGVTGNGPAFRAYVSASFAISLTTWTKIVYDTELFDTANCHLNGRFTPNVAGYYQVNWSAGVSSTSGGTHQTILKKNDYYWSYGSYASPGSNGVISGNQSAGCDLVYFNGSTDYVEVYAYIAAGTSPTVAGGNVYNTTFSAFLVRAA